MDSGPIPGFQEAPRGDSGPIPGFPGGSQPARRSRDHPGARHRLSATMPVTVCCLRWCTQEVCTQGCTTRACCTHPGTTLPYYTLLPCPAVHPAVHTLPNVTAVLVGVHSPGSPGCHSDALPALGPAASDGLIYLSGKPGPGPGCQTRGGLKGFLGFLGFLWASRPGFLP